MVHRRIRIREYGWVVDIFYAVTCYWTGRIMRELEAIDCPEYILEMSYRNLKSCKMDTGLTYSNYLTRETVMVIGLTSSSSEFLNSFDHERKHLEAHIAEACGIDPWGEEIAYLSGNIAQMLAKDVEMFVCHCNCCKDRLKREIENEKDTKGYTVR